MIDRPEPPLKGIEDRFSGEGNLVLLDCHRASKIGFLVKGILFFLIATRTFHPKVWQGIFGSSSSR